MTNREAPPLPDPVGEGQSHTQESRKAMSQRFIIQARSEVDDGNRLQAGEKTWGAVAQLLKMVGEQRGWNHVTHRQVEDIAHLIRAEYPDLDSQLLGDALWAAYKIGHENFYENQYDLDTIRGVVDDVESALPSLERLADEASDRPRFFDIGSNTALRRLKAVTGNNDLRLHQTSPVGFSNRHSNAPTNGPP